MQRISNNRKCMASLAVFRNLFDSDKDIYSVISEFANQIILNNGLHLECDLSTIMSFLKTDYGFEIPESVLRASLRKLPYISIERAKVLIHEKNREYNTKFVADYEEIDKKNNEILDDLLCFVSEKEGRELTAKEKDNLTKAFCAYIIDEDTRIDYGPYIYSFILSIKDKKEYKDQLQLIRDGVISFIGLSYQTHDAQIDTLDRPLTIYLDTEIIFHVAGYNGDVPKKLFDEFYDLVDEINRNSQRSNNQGIIKLRYLEQTFIEIESYFAAAQQILKKKTITNRSKTAMVNILRGCQNPHEIEEKKVSLFSLLRQKNILKEDASFDYENYDNYKLIIEHKKFLDSDSTDETSEERIDDSLRLLQFVRYKRANKPQKYFRSIGHILLTGKRITFEMAMDPAIREENDVPLATTLAFLTNRFWFTLRRGLGDMNLLSFNVIAKTQLAIDSLITKKIGSMYEQIEKEFKDGKLDKATAEKKLAHLRGTEKSLLDNDAEDGFNDYGSIRFLNAEDIDDIVQENENQRRILESKNQELEHANEQKEEKLKSLINRELRRRNKEEEDKYGEQINRYNEDLSQFVENKEKEFRSKSKKVLIYFAVAVVIVFLLHKNETNILELCGNQGISDLVGKLFIYVIDFLFFIMPILFRVIDIEFIRNAYFFFAKEESKNNMRDNWKEEYMNSHPLPEKIEYNFEEIEKELLGMN